MLSWVTSVGLEKMMSLLFCVRPRFFFFNNFLFALLDQLKGLTFYFPCFLLSIFHANLVIRLELLPYIRNGSWYLSLWYSCEASYIPVCLFVCFFLFLLVGNTQHLIVEALIARNLMIFFFLVNSNGHIGILLGTSRMNMNLF